MHSVLVHTKSENAGFSLDHNFPDELFGKTISKQFWSRHVLLVYLIG